MAGIEVREVPIELMRDPKVAQRVEINDSEMPRLVESVKALGVLQPLGARQIDGEFEVVWGHRRLRAATIAGLKRVPVVVVAGSDMELERLKWVENRERRELGVLDEALWISALIRRHKLSQNAMAEALGVSAGYVSQRLAVLNWPGDFQEALASGAVEFGVLRELIRVQDPLVRDEYLGFAVNLGCTVRQAEKWYRQWLADKQAQEGGGRVEEGVPENGESTGGTEECSSCGCGVARVGVQWMPFCEECACGLRSYASERDTGCGDPRSTTHSATPKEW